MKTRNYTSALWKVRNGKRLIDLEEKLLGNFRDKKLLQLYVTLSKSDLQGNYEDTYTIELLFALMCLDLANNSYHRLELIPSDYTLLARNVVRLVDNGELSDYSFINWSNALLSYMKDKNFNAKGINRISTDELKANVFKYVKGSK